jgi:acyl-coenzyme A thioesterase PaaI-like protein
MKLTKILTAGVLAALAESAAVAATVASAPAAHADDGSS